MVAKGFMAAAAIIICCATTLRGNDQETNSSGGDCPTACCDKEKCSVEQTPCADAKCDDKEGCCEKEQVALETCSKGKCNAEKCSTEKCSTETCSTGECAKSKCAKSKCSAENCSKETCSTAKCSTDKCSAEKCTAGKCSGEKCAFTTTLGGLCGPLKCAWEATPVSIGVTVETCSKSACSVESCAIDQGAASMKANVACNADACEGQSCPVAVCATQVCEALKCAVQSCTTASDDDRCHDEICAAGTCGTTQCATLQCSGQDCPAGQCNGAPIKVAGRSGQKCGVNARLTATGGELTFTMAEWFPGTPVAEKCSTEVCTEGACSTAKCEAAKCATSTCSTSKCVTAKCSTEKCSQETCATSKCATETCTADTCDDSACVVENCATSGSELETKLAALDQLHREVTEMRRQSGKPEQLCVNVKVVEINVTRCRSLGFAFDANSPTAAADLSEAIKRSPGILAAFEKNNLARVLANPTLAVASGRPAGFHSGGEFPVSDAEGRTEFKQFGTKVDVLATSIGDRKVQLEIRPEFIQVQGSCGPAPCPALSAHRWDSSFVTTLGSPFVLSSASEQRVVSKKVVDNRKNPVESKVVEDVEEMQCFAVVTVTALGEPAGATTVRHAAYENEASSEYEYEHKLVAKVVEPEFVAKVYPVPDLQVWKVRPQGVQFDADLLIAHLQATIDPQSWRGAVCADPKKAARADGAIQPFERNGSLVICQTEENHRQIANLFQKMRAEGQQKDAARAERELLDGEVTPASAEAPVEQEAKCTKGACSESKCNGPKCAESKCSKSEVSTTTAPAAECTGDCQGECNGQCHGESPETASCPCIGGTCTR